MKFLEPTRKPKVIYTDNPWNLASLARDYPGIIVREHHTDQKQMGLLKEQLRRVKEGTSAVLLQSGLTEEWWADSMECYCYLRNIHENTLRKAVRNACQRTSNTVWSNCRI